jgi:hypothetical protein
VVPPPAAPPVEQAAPVDPQYQVAPPVEYVPAYPSSSDSSPSGRDAGAALGLSTMGLPAEGGGETFIAPADPSAQDAAGAQMPAAYRVTPPPSPAPSTSSATTAHGGINQGSGVPYAQGRRNLDVSQQQNARRIFGFQQEQGRPPPFQPVAPRRVSDNGAITLPAPNGGVLNPLDLFAQGADAAERYRPPEERERRRELEARYAVEPPGTPGTGSNLAAPYNPAVAHASDYLGTGGWHNATLPSGAPLPAGDYSVNAGFPQGIKDAGDWIGNLDGEYYTLPGVSPIRGVVAPQAFDIIRGAVDHAPAPLPIPTIFDLDPAIAQAMYNASPIGPSGAITNLLQAPGGFADFLHDNNYFPLPAPGGTVATPDQEAAKAAALAQLIGGQRPIPPITAAMQGGVATDAAVNAAGTTLDQGIRDAGAELRRRQGIAAGSAMRAQMTGDPTLAVPDISLPSLSLPTIPRMDQRAVDVMNTPLPSFGMPAPDPNSGIIPRLMEAITGEPINPMMVGAETGKTLRTEYDREAVRYQMANARANSLTRDPRYHVEDPNPTAGQGVQQQEPAPPPYDPLSSAYPVSDPSPSLGAQLGQWGGDRLNDVRGILPEYEVSPPNVSLPTGGDVRALPDRLSTAIQGVQMPHVSLPGGLPGATPSTPAPSPATGWNAARTALEGNAAPTATPDGEVTISHEAGVDWVKNAQGEYVGLVDPSTGEPVRFPDGSSDEEKDAFVAQLRAKAPAAEQTPTTTTSDTAPIKTIGAEPDYAVESPTEETSSSGGGNQGTYSNEYSNDYANDYANSFSRSDYGYDYDARTGSGRSYDSYDDDGDADLNLEDFLKDFDGDGTIGSKDRSLAKKAMLSARRKRGKSKSSSFDPFNRPESPLRTQILDELDAALPKGAPARRKQRGGAR